MVPAGLPPLRERREDIPLLVTTFGAIQRLKGRTLPSASDAALARLMET